MNVLITGGAGFIGSHLVEKFLKEKHRVIVVDNFDSFYSMDIKVLNVLESINKKELKEKILALKDDEKLISLIKYTESDNYKLYVEDICNLENLKEFAKFEDVLDLLYNLKTPINLDDAKYKSLFYAKGDIDESCEIYGFELNVIKRLKDAKFDAAGLSFNYVCKNCKNSFPMHFYRCPVCHELGSVKILSHITEKPSEDSNTF